MSALGQKRTLLTVPPVRSRYPSVPDVYRRRGRDGFQLTHRPSTTYARITGMLDA